MKMMMQMKTMREKLVVLSQGVVHLGDADDLLHGGLGAHDAAPAVVAESVHAVGDGAFLELGSRGLADNEALELVGDDAKLVDGGPAAVPGLPAGGAPGAVVELHVLGHGGADFAEVIDRIAGLDLAIGTNGADEALGDEGADDAGEEEGLDAHVEETGNPAYSIIGVKRGKDEVACHGRANG